MKIQGVFLCVVIIEYIGGLWWFGCRLVCREYVNVNAKFFIESLYWKYLFIIQYYQINVKSYLGFGDKVGLNWFISFEGINSVQS